MKKIQHMGPEGITHVFTVQSDKAKELIVAHRKHPLTKSIEVISKNEKEVTFLLTSESDIGIAHALAKSKCIILGPVITEDESDKLTIFAPSWNAYRAFIESLPEEFEVSVKSKRTIDSKTGPEIDAFKVVGFLELKSLSELMSARQIEILNVAIGKGYYSKPRRITLNDLADYLDIAPATLSEHLMKIESKVMPIVSKILGTF